MGMAKSIGFLVSSPNTNLNGDIFVVECIVELQQKFAKPYKCSPQSL